MRFLRILSFAALLASAGAVQGDPSFWRHEWPDTDFGKTTINNWVELLSGGPPKDGIPALDNPQFVRVAEKSGLGEREAVLTVEIEGQEPRAYPVRYPTWHEIVNDRIGMLPVAVTFCLLCNSGLTFDRRVNGRVLSFGVSGKLRNSDMVMCDRETQSWWQQAIGTGIVGDMTGVELEQLPSWMVSWSEYKERNPTGLVMAIPPWPRTYGRNPCVSYDSSHRPFLYNGEMPPHGIPALARVVRFGDRAWPLSRLSKEGRVMEDGLTFTRESGQSSALDARDIGGGKDVGTVRVRDATGNNVPHDVMFAFAFHAFWPDGRWMLGE